MTYVGVIDCCIMLVCSSFHIMQSIVVHIYFLSGYYLNIKALYILLGMYKYINHLLDGGGCGGALHC